MRAVFLDYDPLSSAGLDLGALRAVVPDLRLFEGTRPAELAARLRDADVVLLDQTPLPGAALAAAPQLRLIALAGTGYNNVDWQRARELGIAVCNVPGYCTASVVQHVWSLILSLTQHLDHYARLATGGAWSSGRSIDVGTQSIRELAGRRLGIIGWGDLGRGVAAVAGAFGMEVIVANRPGAAAAAGRIEFNEFLAQADVVSLHCPLTPETRGLIGRRELELMKPDALLINTARGALIDAAALADALKSGRLGGAGIDVLAEEPPIHGDPLLGPAIPRLIVTPHVAWAAREARQRSLDEMAANIRDFLGGGRRSRIV
jgi:glycerate dehydrogenase